MIRMEKGGRQLLQMQMLAKKTLRVVMDTWTPNEPNSNHMTFNEEVGYEFLVVSTMNEQQEIFG